MSILSVYGITTHIIWTPYVSTHRMPMNYYNLSVQEMHQHMKGLYPPLALIVNLNYINIRFNSDSLWLLLIHNKQQNLRSTFQSSYVQNTFQYIRILKIMENQIHCNLWYYDNQTCHIQRPFDSHRPLCEDHIGCNNEILTGPLFDINMSISN